MKISAKVISYIALAVSIISLYFQFFHINHELKYATLYPILDQEEKKLIFPIFLKNTGNQTETILDFKLLLEARENNESFYKRISNLDEPQFFSIMNPGESKRIDLIGYYDIYLFGTIVTEENNFYYKPISELEDLNLILQTTYLTKKGVAATQERVIGKITFTSSETIKRIDCPPIELQELDLGNDDFEIFQYSLIPDNKQYGSLSVDFTDSTSIKNNLDKLLFLERVMNSDKEENYETLKILEEILRPYR